MSVRVAVVVVSHSDQLAAGLATLAAQMAPDVPIRPAGGMGGGGLGTSYELIEAAVEGALAALTDKDPDATSLDVRGGGVVILTDLGSATMTAESVIDMADEPDLLVLVDAPVVEGAVAAAVAAQMGEDLQRVAQAARDAAKQWADRSGDGQRQDDAGGAGHRLGTNEGRQASPAAAAQTDPVAQASASVQASPAAPAVTATAKIADPVGLHARPAALIARLAAGFDAEVTIDGVDATSVLELMMLGHRHGATVTVSATGPDAAAAVDAIVTEIENPTQHPDT